MERPLIVVWQEGALFNPQGLELSINQTGMSFGRLVQNLLCNSPTDDVIVAETLRGEFNAALITNQFDPLLFRIAAIRWLGHISIVHIKTCTLPNHIKIAKSIFIEIIHHDGYLNVGQQRSEERRVGKECRWR